jgi:hypothetical protein
MRKLALVLTLIAVTISVGLAQKRVVNSVRQKPKSVAVAFYDATRLRDRGAAQELKDFQYFFKDIYQIAAHDFPNVEFKILQRGELLRLPDGTSLNVQTMRPDLGYVLSQTGKKPRILSGIQTDADFACAASTFFNQPSSACPK